jgi:predicted metal-dependent hydrolase
MKHVTKKDRTLSYKISLKAIKNTYFRIKDNYIQITTHPHTSIKDIENYIYNHFDHLYDKMTKERVIESDQHITLWNKTYELIITKGYFHYEIIDDFVYVKALTDDVNSIKKRIYQIECQQMIIKMHHEIKDILDIFKIKVLPYKIKYLKSKFGSYHKQHQTITINSFLAKLEPFNLKYVLLHEYAHTIEFNHSKSFYQLLDQMMPGHKNIQKALKKCAIH